MIIVPEDQVGFEAYKHGIVVTSMLILYEN